MGCRSASNSFPDAGTGVESHPTPQFCAETTQTNPGLLCSPNLLLVMPPVEHINQVWVGDITYLPMADGGWAYLAVWMDLFSRFIPCRHLSRSLEARLVIHSFEKAIQRRRPPPGFTAAYSVFKSALPKAGFRHISTVPAFLFDFHRHRAGNCHLISAGLQWALFQYKNRFVCKKLENKFLITPIFCLCIPILRPHTFVSWQTTK